MVSRTAPHRRLPNPARPFSADRPRCARTYLSPAFARVRFRASASMPDRRLAKLIRGHARTAALDPTLVRRARKHVRVNRRRTLLWSSLPETAPRPSLPESDHQTPQNAAEKREGPGDLSAGPSVNLRGLGRTQARFGSPQVVLRELVLCGHSLQRAREGIGLFSCMLRRSRERNEAGEGRRETKHGGAVCPTRWAGGCFGCEPRTRREDRTYRTVVPGPETRSLAAPVGCHSDPRSKGPRPVYVEFPSQGTAASTLTDQSIEQESESGDDRPDQPLDEEHGRQRPCPPGSTRRVQWFIIVGIRSDRLCNTRMPGV